MEIPTSISSSFKACLVHKETILGVDYSIYDNQIIHVVYPEFVKLDLATAIQGEKLLERLNLGPHCFLLEFHSFADITKEAREFGARPEAAEISIVDAIVVKNIGLKIIANAYMKFNQPKTPTKFFNSQDKALDWIFLMKETLNR